jgi:hypothetical protein
MMTRVRLRERTVKVERMKSVRTGWGHTNSEEEWEGDKRIRWGRTVKVEMMKIARRVTSIRLRAIQAATKTRITMFIAVTT